jgi:hypothetical protein
MDKPAHCVSNPGRAIPSACSHGPRARPRHTGRWAAWGTAFTPRTGRMPLGAAVHELPGRPDVQQGSTATRAARSDSGRPSRRTTEHRQASVTGPQVVCKQGVTGSSPVASTGRRARSGAVRHPSWPSPEGPAPVGAPLPCHSAGELLVSALVGAVHPGQGRKPVRDPDDPNPRKAATFMRPMAEGSRQLLGPGTPRHSGHFRGRSARVWLAHRHSALPGPSRGRFVPSPSGHQHTRRRHRLARHPPAARQEQLGDCGVHCGRDGRVRRVARVPVDECCSWAVVPHRRHESRVLAQSSTPGCCPCVSDRGSAARALRATPSSRQLMRSPSEGRGSWPGLRVDEPAPAPRRQG